MAQPTTLRLGFFDDGYTQFFYFFFYSEVDGVHFEKFTLFFIVIL